LLHKSFGDRLSKVVVSTDRIEFEELRVLSDLTLPDVSYL
jgi:hypothetical protein